MYQLLLVPGFCRLHRIKVLLVAVHLQLDFERFHALGVCIEVSDILTVLFPQI